MRSIHCCVNDKIVHIGIKIHWELMLYEDDEEDEVWE